MMVAPLLLLSFTGHTPGDVPVRVWLGSAGAVMPGMRVPVHVQAAVDGYLVVLNCRPDGSVEVLFPGDPATDPFTRAGTYEIQGPGGAAGLTASGQGSGVVLAALSPDPFRFAEFVRGGRWASDMLTAATLGADAEGALTDIVQRMLGDGSFNYDIATYTVAPPRTYALEDTAGAPVPTPTDVNALIVDAPLFATFPEFHHRRPLRAPDPALPSPATTLAVYRRGQLALGPGLAGESQARVVSRGPSPAVPVNTRPRNLEPRDVVHPVIRTLPPIVIVQRHVRQSISTEVRPRAVPAVVLPRRAAPAPAVATETAPALVLVPPAHPVGTARTPRTTPPPSFRTAGWHH